MIEVDQKSIKNIPDEEVKEQQNNKKYCLLTLREK